MTLRHGLCASSGTRQRSIRRQHSLMKTPECTDHLDGEDHPNNIPAANTSRGEKETEDGDPTESPVAARDLSHNLAVAHGRVHEANARILIDGGAQVDLMSKRFVEEQRVGSVLGSGQGLRVQLIGGQIQDASIITQSTKVQFGQWSADSTYHVTELEEYDVIWGKPWLTTHNPQINWRTNGSAHGG